MVEMVAGITLLVIASRLMNGVGALEPAADPANPETSSNKNEEVSPIKGTTEAPSKEYEYLPDPYNPEITIKKEKNLSTVKTTTTEANKEIEELTPVKDSELVFAFVIHQHGQVTPPRDTLQRFGMLNKELKSLMDQLGYDQITDAGLETAFYTGDFILRRYRALLEPKYNDVDLYVRSVDTARSKMSVLAAMTAVFPANANDTWSQDINWVPVPYSTVPLEKDRLLGMFGNCQRLVNTFTEKSKQSAYTRLYKYRNGLLKLGKALGIKDVKQIPFSAIIDTWIIINGLEGTGYNISKEWMDIYSELSPTATDEAWIYLFEDIDTANILSSNLIKEFIQYADMFIKGESTPRLRVYSADALNIYSIQKYTIGVSEGRPKFGSIYSLELRYRARDDKYIIVPIFVDDPYVGEFKYLHIRECRYYGCEYPAFKMIEEYKSLEQKKLDQKCSTDQLNPYLDYSRL
ncbi:hypothetical protein O0L34_g10312 [Tuta absoluta]|nr:hypothetical protein O0L34_g10312 [Tuta absoluta]